MSADPHATASASTGPLTTSTVIDLSPGKAGRVLCVADIRGDFKKLNEMVREAGAVAVVHTGDFGFLDGTSPMRMSPRVLRHTLQYTPLIADDARPSFLAHAHGPHLFSLLHPEPSSPASFVLSQLGGLLAGDITFSVPVYVVYGPTEDVRVLEKFRTGEYAVKNLMVVDEAATRLLDVGGVKLRLLGLGGSLQMSKIFDNGEGVGTIAGGNGMVWATALQIGELVDTAQRVFDPTETRLLITHGSMGKEGLLAQLSLALKADFTISGSLHFRFIASFNEFNVQSDQEMFKEKLNRSKKAFMEIYESARGQLESMMQADQREFLAKAVQVAQKMPAFDGSEEDNLWKNTWNWNLAEAGYGDLILIIREGRISADTHSSGFNFSYRRPQKPKAVAPAVPTPAGVPVVAPPQQPMSRMPAVQRPVQQPIGFSRPAFSQQPGSALARPPPNAAPSHSALPNKPAPAQAASRAAGPTVAVPQSKPAPVNGAAAHAKPEVGKPARERTPASAQGQRPPENGVKEDATQSGRKQRTLREAASPAVAANGSASAAQATNGASTGKDADEKNQAAEPSKSGAQPREPREPREKRPRGGKNRDEKTKAAGDAPGPKTDATEASKPAYADKPAANADADKADDKPSPSATPKPPVYALYCKSLPNGTSEDDLRGLFNAGIQATISRIKVISQPSQGDPPKPRGYGYIEFGSEEAMQAALAKHTDTVKDVKISIVVSNPPGRIARPSGRSSGRGGGRGGKAGKPSGGADGRDGASKAAGGDS